MDPRDKWQVNEDALRQHMRGPRPMPAADPEPGWGLPRWLKVSGLVLAGFVGFIALVLVLGSGYSDEDYRRDHAGEQAELLCKKMMADATLGAERRATREHCDALLRRYGKTLPP